MRITRREALRGLGAGALVLGIGQLLGATSAAAAEPAAAAKPPRPPNTCGGWSDGAGNGICDRSENGGRCGALKCPGHGGNTLRDAAKRAGAPTGTCALWQSSGAKGYCAVCDRPAKPCLYAKCPAHKDNTQRIPAAARAGG